MQNKYIFEVRYVSHNCLVKIALYLFEILCSVEKYNINKYNQIFDHQCYDFHNPKQVLPTKKSRKCCQDKKSFVQLGPLTSSTAIYLILFNKFLGFEVPT